MKIDKKKNSLKIIVFGFLMNFFLTEARGLSPEESEQQSLPAKTAAAQKIQTWWRSAKAYQSFFREYGISIKEASRENIKRLHEEIGRLSPSERRVYLLIQENFRLLHATKSEGFLKISQTGYLKSTLQLQREAEGRVRSHTGQSNMHAFVFFTGGVGSHPSVQFLGPDVVLFEGDFLTLERENQISNIFVAPHSSQFMKQDVYPEVSIHGVSFRCEHFEDYRKKYSYKGPKGTFEKTVTMRDEIFAGRELLQGLSYEFLAHVRRLKVFQEDQEACILQDILNARDPLRALEHLFESFMPGDDRLEMKVPQCIRIDRNFVRSIRSSDLPLLPEKLSHDQYISSIIAAKEVFFRESEGQKLDLYFEENQVPWLSNTFYGKLFIESIFRDLNPSLAYEVFQKLNAMRIGDFFKRKAHQESLKRASQASQADNPIEILSKLFDVRVESCHLSGLSYTPSADFPESDASLLSTITEDLGMIYEAVASGNLHLLEFFVEKGSRALSIRPSALVYVSALYNRLNVLSYLKDRGVVLSPSDPVAKGALEIFIKKGNREGVEILEKMGMDLRPNSRVHKFKGLWTPLHLAAMSNQSALAEWLIKVRGLDPKARTLEGKTSHAIAAEKKAPKVLAFLNKEYPLTEEEKKLTPFEGCSEKSFNVVSLICGTRKGNPTFILGRNRAEKQEGLPCWKLPGGSIDPEDVTLEAAALREGEEETGLPLLRLHREKQIRAQVMHGTSLIVGEIGSEVSFVRIDGVNFDEYIPYARDDLDTVKLVGVSDFEDKGGEDLRGRYWHNGEPIQGSNGYIINYALGRGAEVSDQKLKEFLSYENFGDLLMQQALVSGNLPEIQRLQAIGISLEKNKPLQIAYHHKHMALLRYLKEKGLSSLYESYVVCKNAISFDQREAFELLFREDFTDYHIVDFYSVSPKSDFYREKIELLIKKRKLYNHIFPAVKDSEYMRIVQAGLSSPLVLAAKHGDHRALEEFLEDGGVAEGNVSFKDMSFSLGYHTVLTASFLVESPLLVSILNRHVRCVQVLLKRMTPNVTSCLNRDNQPQAFQTHPRGDDRSLRLRLLSLVFTPESQVDSFYWDNIPALFLAALSQNEEIASLVLNHPGLNKSITWKQRLLNGQIKDVSIEDFFDHYDLKSLISEEMKNLYRSHFPSIKE